MFREMRRCKQQVSEEECVHILQNGKRGVLAVLGDDGYPYTVPLDFVYEDGNIYFHCAKEGHKIDAIRACDKVSFCVLNEGYQEPEDWWYHFTSVVVFGRIRIVEDEVQKDKKLRLLGRKYFPTEEILEEEMRGFAARAEVLCLTIEYMTGKQVREK